VVLVVPLILFYTRGMKDFFHHLFIPRESNNHRSKILHHQSLLLVILFLLTGLSALSFAQKSYPAVLGISANISIQDLLSQTNQKRQENGISPLVLNAELTHAAEMKADDMFAKNYWAHVSPDGTTPWVFIKNAGYEYLYAGENLARGFTTAPDTVNAWMASPTHRENLLSPNFKEIGFAVKAGSLTGAETILVVQEFGSKYGGTKEVDAPAVIVDQNQVSPIPTILPTAPVAKTAVAITVAAPTQKPQVLPSSDPKPIEKPAESQDTMVAAIQNNPLVDSKSTKQNVALFVLVLFIGIFVIDAIIIERKKIVRLVSHNLDHIIFLSVILIAAIIIGKGVIL
jgi:uncharacterized protein YkwD